MEVQFSCSVMTNSLWPHELQHTRPPSITNSNFCPLSQWCHPTISSSVVLFSSCPQSFPASGSFQMSQLFASSRQSIGLSASTSVLPMNQSFQCSSEHSGLISFKMDWFDLLVVQGSLKSLLQHCSLEPSILWCSAFFFDQLSTPYMTTGRTVSFTRQTFVSKVMSLLFKMLI